MGVGVQCLRVKSETLSKTFKRTQIPRGQDKTCISQVEYGQGAWQTEPVSPAGCECETEPESAMVECVCV